MVTTNENIFFKAGKIVVLEGSIAHIKGNKEDLILRLDKDLLEGCDKITKAINLGYGNIREATLKEKEYWFLCHDNSNVANGANGACFMSNYRNWLAWQEES